MTDPLAKPATYTPKTLIQMPLPLLILTTTVTFGERNKVL